MRIAIIAFGSRGDVQPYVALGKGLHGAGHDVRLVTHEDFEGLVREHGLDYWLARGSVQKAIDTDEMRRLIEQGNFIKITRATSKLAQQATLQWAEDGLVACQDRELIIAGVGGLFIGFALAEKLSIPFLQAYVFPFTPTKAFPSVLLPANAPRLPGPMVAMSHYLTQQMMWQGSRTADGLARRQVLHLPAAPFMGPFKSKRLQRSPILYGFSPSVLPKPADWGEDVHVTGYWFLDEPDEWTQPLALIEFLQRGPAPVYVGFGSMGSRKPEETADIVLQALVQTGQRAILSSGWGGLHAESLPESVFMLKAIPHAWLFPRVAAVVHHGGAGTTAAGLRAGVPTIVVPFFGDQPFWGRRVAALGVGPEPIARQALTAERLAQAIQRAVTNPTMRHKAAELGAKIRAENGVAAAVQHIERFGKRIAAA